MPPRRAKPRVGDPMVPAKPFSDWLNERYERYQREYNQRESLVGPTVRLGKEIGFDAGVSDDKSLARRLYRYRHMITETGTGSRRKGTFKRVVRAIEEFPRSVVQEALDTVDRDLFYEVYPQYAHERAETILYDDVTLEPDAYCPHCQEWVTPIDGLCPWCVCEHGHLFREVGISDDGFVCLACAKEEQREKNVACQRRAREAA